MFRNKLNDDDAKQQIAIQDKKIKELSSCLNIYNSKVLDIVKSSFKALTNACQKLKVYSSDKLNRAGEWLSPIAHEVKVTFIKVLNRSYQIAKSVFVHYKNQFIDYSKPAFDFIKGKLEDAFPKVKASLVSLKEGLASGDRDSWIKASQMALPVVSVLMMVITINYWNHLNYGLVLACEGEEIATIQDEKVFEKANQMVSKRLVYDGDSEDEFVVSPSYKLAIVKEDKYSNPNDVCNKIIEQSKGTIEEATGVYINDDLVGVVKEGDKVTDLLDSVLADACDEENVEVDFVEDVQSINGLYFANSVVGFDDLKNILVNPVEADELYTVQDGDSILSIAEKFDMSTEELASLNSGDLNDKMYPGETIIVRGPKNLLTVKVIKEESYEKAIGYNTIETKDDSEYKDYSKVIRNGEDGLESCVDRVTYISGVEVSRERVTSDIIRPAVDKQVVVGTKERSSSNYYSYEGTGNSTGSLMWPTPSVRGITSGYGYRGGYMHSGIDISSCGAYGQTIVAADGGVVTLVQYSCYGYGYHVQINHGNGFSTLYAHCSSIYVTPGQRVSKGQPIAAIGSTGDSTGPHLHFEVAINGCRVNPINYV